MDGCDDQLIHNCEPDKEIAMRKTLIDTECFGSLCITAQGSYEHLTALAFQDKAFTGAPAKL